MERLSRKTTMQLCRFTPNKESNDSTAHANRVFMRDPATLRVMCDGCAAASPMRRSNVHREASEMDDPGPHPKMSR
jgi:hypothetical protein